MRGLGDPHRFGRVVRGGLSASSFRLTGAVLVHPRGDSITQGQGSSDGFGYRSALRLALAASLPGVAATFVGPYGSAPNQHGGNPGRTIAEIQSDYLAAYPSPPTEVVPPDVVILMAGTNDTDAAGPAYVGAAAQAAFGALLDAIVSRHEEFDRAVQVVVVSPPTVNPSYVAPADEALRDNLADYAPRCLLEARKRSFLVVDLHAESLS